MVFAKGAHISDKFSQTAESAPQRQFVIFTSDCLIAHMHLNGILPYLRENNIKPLVFLMPDTKSPRAQIAPLQRYDFYETAIANDVIYPALEAQEKTAQRITPTFNQMAREFGFETITVESQKDPRILDALNADGHIGAISIYQDQIFKPDLINAARAKGFFWNLHPAVLPGNGGLYLIFWNMMRGRMRHGCTLHEINEGIDTGRIISTSHGRLTHNKSVLTQYLEFVQGGSELIKKALTQQLRTGRVSYKPVAVNPESGYFAIPNDNAAQNDTPDVARRKFNLIGPAQDTGYFSFPTEDDIDAGARRGIRLIGSPEEMTQTFTRIFGNSAIIRDKVMNAICEYEGIEQDKAAQSDQEATMSSAAMSRLIYRRAAAANLG